MIIPPETAALVSTAGRSQEMHCMCTKIFGERACLRRLRDTAVLRLSCWCSLISASTWCCWTGLSLLLGPPGELESITQGWGTDYHSLSFIHVFYTLNTTQYSEYLSSSIITFSSRISTLLEASQGPWKNMTENILLFLYCVLGSVGDIRWWKTVFKSCRYIGRKESLFVN